MSSWSESFPLFLWVLPNSIFSFNNSLCYLFKLVRDLFSSLALILFLLLLLFLASAFFIIFLSNLFFYNSYSSRLYFFFEYWSSWFLSNHGIASISTVLWTKDLIDLPRIYFMRGILYMKNDCAVLPMSTFLNSNM